MAEHIRHICLLCLVTLQGEDGDTHFLHLMCLLLQPMPSVNMQLLDSHFSFGASSWVELASACHWFCIFPSFIRRLLFLRWLTSNTFKVKSAVVRDYYLIALAGC